MASSGNFEKKIAGGSTGGYYVGVDWKVNSQSTTNVSSNVTASVYIRSTGNGYTISSSTSKDISLTINGTKYTGTNTIGIGANTKKTLLTKTVDVKHNSDGTKTCAFACSVYVGFTLSGTSLTTVSTSGNGTFNTINVNSAPTMSGSLSVSPSGTIAENVSTINLSWTKAADAQNNANKYQIYRYINGTHNKTIDISNINTLSYSDTTINSFGEGTQIYYKIWAGDSYGTWSNALTSATVTKNTFTGAYFTGHSNNIAWDTTSFSLYVDGAKNTNGNTTFKYYYYSDDVTVYNQADSTSKTGTISIWRDSVGGSQPSGPYIKLSDLKNKFKGSNFTGNLHVGVRTTNAYGTQKWAGGSIGVDLRATPVAATPTISEDASLSTALKTVKSTSNKYFLPNGSDKIRISWSGGSDRIGEAIQYDVQIKIGSGSYETKASNITSTTYDLVLPKQATSQQIVARVITKTTYGYTANKDSAAKTLHYYNAPTLDVIEIDRTDTTATASIMLRANTSIPNINFPTRTYSGISTGTLTNTTSKQQITASGLKGESTYSWTVTFNDDTGFTSSNQSKSINIPAYTPLFSVREKGVGVNAIPNGEADLMVGGKAKITQGTYIHTANGVAGTTGYVKIANIKVTQNYQNQPIEFKIAQRGRKVQPTISLMLTSVNSTSPTVSSFSKDSSEVNTWVKDNGNGDFDIYIQKTEGYDKIDVVDFNKGTYMNGTTVTWLNVQAEAIPSGSTAASVVGGISLLQVYPVGSIYMSVNSTNPSSLFGGTWVAWGSGRVPVGINTGDGDFNTVEKTGGAKSVSSSHTHSTANHTLTLSQIPAHNHSASSASAGAHTHDIQNQKTKWGSGSGNYAIIDATSGYTAVSNKTTTSAGAHSHTITVNNSGGGGAHNHGNTGSASVSANVLQPYIVCYMWKRTA